MLNIYRSGTAAEGCQGFYSFYLANVIDERCQFHSFRGPHAPRGRLEPLAILLSPKASPGKKTDASSHSASLHLCENNWSGTLSPNRGHKRVMASSKNMRVWRITFESVYGGSTLSSWRPAEAKFPELRQQKVETTSSTLQRASDV